MFSIKKCCVHTNDYTNTAWQSTSWEWMAAQETISAYFKWVVNAPCWVLHPTSQSKQHSGQSPAHSLTLWQVLASSQAFMPVMDFWACNSNNYMSLYCPGALTKILNLVKWQDKMLKSAECTFSKWQDRQIHTGCLSDEGRVCRMLSLTRNSEITTGLSQCAYGSSPLK